MEKKNHSTYFFIDWDGTLVSSNSVLYVEFIRRYFFKHGRLYQKVFYPLVFVFLPFILITNFIKKEKIRDGLSYFLYYGLTKDEIYKASTEFWQKNQHYFNENVYLHIKKELDSNDFSNVYIVSGSIDTIIEAAFDVFNIEFFKQKIHSTQLNYKESKTTGITKDRIFVIGEQKVIVIKKILSAKDSESNTIIVYTDSSSDLPMLSISNYAKLVRPDKKLKLMCKQNDWEII